jgi:galactose-1-phosphate uridylyltransferase
MTWNYMPPSGGGLVHPHQQYFATKHPGNQFTDEIEASERYFRAHHTSFWKEYIELEIAIGQRYIGQVGTSHWLSTFVSFGFRGDISCVFDDAFSLEDLRDDHIDDLISGLLNVFRYYESRGIFSFNVAFFIGPSNQQFFPCHLRITPRTFLNTRDFSSDTNFFQTLLSEPISVLLPETVCSEAKPFF